MSFEQALAESIRRQHEIRQAVADAATEVEQQLEGERERLGAVEDAAAGRVD